MNKLYIPFILLLAFIITFTACKQVDNLNPELDGVAEIKFNFSGVSTSSKLAKTYNKNNDNKIQLVGYKKIDDNKELVLELSEDNSEMPSTFDIKNLALKKDILQKQSAIVSTPLESGIGYLVVAFNKSDSTYVNEAFYTSNNEANTNFTLPSGREYIFVAFTFNLPHRTVDGDYIIIIKPKLNFIDNVRKLNNAVIDKIQYILNGSPVDISLANLPYYYQRIDNMGVLNSGHYNVNLVFKQQQALLRIKKDLSLTNYDDNYLGLTNIRFTSDEVITGNQNKIYLNTGIVNQDEPRNTNFNFQPINQQNEYLINLRSENVVTNIIADLYRNVLEQSNIVIENISLKRGSRYTLKFKIRPTDRDTIYKEYPAVLINGRIWMKHVLGANTTAKFNVTELSKSHYGNYYFWGTKDPIANVDGLIAGSNGPPDYSEATYATRWNNGTEDEPIKNTDYDPCPIGWRVPTFKEILDVVDLYTTYSPEGNYGAYVATNDYNYTVGFSSKSIRDANVLLVYPATGVFKYDAQTFEDKGIAYFFMSSIYPGYEKKAIYRLSDNGKQIPIVSEYNRNVAYPVRCVAE